ncbi:hypothetical protein [Pseudomonas sp. LB1P83]
MASIRTSHTSAPDQLTTVNRSEKEDINRALEILIHGAEDHQEVDLSSLQIPHSRGSSFDDIYDPGRALLEKLVLTPDFSKLSETLAIFDKASCLRVSAQGDLHVRRHTPWTSLNDKLQYFPDLEESLSLIAEIAALAGGYIYFNDHVSVEQWLTFHQFDIPKTVNETKNLIGFLHIDLPDSPPVGNYWYALSGSENSPFSLSIEEREHVLALTRQVFKHPHEILEELARPVIAGKPIEEVEAGAGYLLDQILETERAIEWAREYSAVVGWYGSLEGQPACKEHLQSLLLAAIILGFDPSAGQVRNQIAGYDLYQPGNVDRSPLEVRADLEDHLHRLNKGAGLATPLASLILLAGIAPEFTVRDLPESLRLGTPAWVTLSQAVALAELNAPGSSRIMNYAQLLDFAALEPVTKELSLLQSVVTINPVINWAAINGVVSPDADGNYDERVLQDATFAFKQYIHDFDNVISALSSPLPSRETLARTQLQKELAGCDFLDKKIFVQEGKGFYGSRGSSLKMSMVDLHMSDDLAPGEWDRRGTSVYTSFPQVTTLYPVSELFEPAFNAYYEKLEAAIVATIKLALSQLPQQDRIALQAGEVSFYTIRKPVAILHNMSGSSVGLVGANTQPGQLKETQIDKDAATCRYGIVLCATYQGRLSCYEVFTLRGECRKNPGLGRILVNSGKINSLSRVDFKGSMTDPTPAISPLSLPIDFNAYNQGVEPITDISSHAVIEKLGVLPATLPLAPTTSGPYQSFCSEPFKAIASFIFKHRPMASYEELYRNAEGRTALELEREKAERIGTFIIDLVVPFKRCIEDLSSDDKTRQAEGAVGCIIDGLALLGTVVGVAGKFASAAAKTASLTSRTAHLARIGAGVTFSIFNPLDGTPQLLFGGARLLKKGFLKLSSQAAAALESATFQLHRLTGSAQSYDLLKAVNRKDVVFGTWRPLGDAGEPVSIWAIRDEKQWFGLNLRTGEPWGPALKNFRITKDPIRVPGWHRVMPKSYARSVIKEGLPLASKKVDDAIHVLNDPTLIQESNAVLNLLLANDSSAARSTYRDYLIAVREDLSNIKPGNFIIDSSKESETIAELHWGLYNDWKTGNKAQNANNEFIRVYSNNFNEAYRKDHFNPGITADTFVHEIFHGTPKTKDFAYAGHSGIFQRGSQQLDVSPLLNLANGKISMGLPSFPNANYNSGTAFKNADSFALTTSLLSQLKTNKQAYQQNIAIMKAALKNANHEYISGQTLVKINIL